MPSAMRSAISLIGNAGNGTLTAGSGNETLTAGSGTDTLVGGSGNDTFVVNSSSDVIQDTSTTASNVLQSSVSYTRAAHVNTLMRTGTGNIVGTGNAAADSLIGAAGNDTLVAGAGADTLIGGTGYTTFVVNNTSDVVIDTTTTGANAIQSPSVSFVLPTNVDTLTLTGSVRI